MDRKTELYNKIRKKLSYPPELAMPSMITGVRVGMGFAWRALSHKYGRLALPFLLFDPDPSKSKVAMKAALVMLMFVLCVRCSGNRSAIVAMIASMGLLALAARGLPIGTAYAVWTGIGAAGTAIAGIILFDEPATAARLVCIVLIVAGVVGLRVFAR